MTKPHLTPELRAQLLAAPRLLLEDRDLMRALIEANDTAIGENVIDIRGRWMARLEGRLDALEATHKGVLAAAYDNVSGTRQIQRAVLALLEPHDAAALLDQIGVRLADILRLDSVRLVIEGDLPARWVGAETLIDTLPEGGVSALLAARKARTDGVTLRACGPESARVHRGADSPILSEALLPLELAGRAALLILGSAEAGTFAPPQGTDLLRFLAGVVQRQLVRVL